MDHTGLSIVFPCRVGDIVYSFEWDAPDSRYVIVEAKCMGFNVRTNESYDILLKGDKYEYLRSGAQYRENWFASPEEAGAKLKSLNREE